MTPGESVRSVLAPLHPEGARFVVGAALATLPLFWLWSPLGWLGVAATLFCAYFFRNPDRVTPTDKGLVISPADGVVAQVDTAAPPAELEMGAEPRQRVSIFLSIFDVHINRVPIDGRVTKIAYRPGRFINAALDKASEDNERMSVKLQTEAGEVIGVVQIAGLIARRIVCDLSEGQAVEAGERYGMIRFGSRVDVYLPANATPVVAEGQRAIAGETVLADPAAKAPRRGEQR